MEAEHDDSYGRFNDCRMFTFFPVVKMTESRMKENTHGCFAFADKPSLRQHDRRPDPHRRGKVEPARPRCGLAVRLSGNTGQPQRNIKGEH